MSEPLSVSSASQCIVGIDLEILYKDLFEDVSQFTHEQIGVICLLRMESISHVLPVYKRAICAIKELGYLFINPKKDFLYTKRKITNLNLKLIQSKIFEKEIAFASLEHHKAALCFSHVILSCQVTILRSVASKLQLPIKIYSDLMSESYERLAKMSLHHIDLDQLSKDKFQLLELDKILSFIKKWLNKESVKNLFKGDAVVEESTFHLFSLKTLKGLQDKLTKYIDFLCSFTAYREKVQDFLKRYPIHLVISFEDFISMIGKYESYMIEAAKISLEWKSFIGDFPEVYMVSEVIEESHILCSGRIIECLKLLNLDIRGKSDEFERDLTGAVMRFSTGDLSALTAPILDKTYAIFSVLDKLGEILYSEINTSIHIVFCDLQLLSILQEDIFFPFKSICSCILSLEQINPSVISQLASIKSKMDSPSEELRVFQQEFASEDLSARIEIFHKLSKSISQGISLFLSNELDKHVKCELSILRGLLEEVDKTGIDHQFLKSKIAIFEWILFEFPKDLLEESDYRRIVSSFLIEFHQAQSLVLSYNAHKIIERGHLEINASSISIFQDCLEDVTKFILRVQENPVLSKRIMSIQLMQQDRVRDLRRIFLKSWEIKIIDIANDLSLLCPVENAGLLHTRMHEVKRLKMAIRKMPKNLWIKEQHDEISRGLSGLVSLAENAAYLISSSHLKNINLENRQEANLIYSYLMRCLHSSEEKTALFQTEISMQVQRLEKEITEKLSEYFLKTFKELGFEFPSAAKDFKEIQQQIFFVITLLSKEIDDLKILNGRASKDISMCKMTRVLSDLEKLIYPFCSFAHPENIFYSSLTALTKLLTSFQQIVQETYYEEFTEIRSQVEDALLLPMVFEVKYQCGRSLDNFIHKRIQPFMMFETIASGPLFEILSCLENLKRRLDSSCPDPERDIF